MAVSGLVPAGTRVLLLTGTCGSGKSTIAALIGARPGWVHVSEDDVWARRFDKSRGAFGTAEHREKRRLVHEIVFESLRTALAADLTVALDVTVHESPPEAYRKYLEFFERHRMAWALRVLHPNLEVAIARDAARERGRMGRAHVASLHAKFTGQVFPAEWFLDTSMETPEESVRRLFDPSMHALARRLEQLDRVAVRIFELDLLAAGADFDLVAKAQPSLPQCLHLRGKVHHLEHHAVPSTRFLGSAVGQGP